MVLTHQVTSPGLMPPTEIVYCLFSAHKYYHTHIIIMSVPATSRRASKHGLWGLIENMNFSFFFVFIF